MNKGFQTTLNNFKIDSPAVSCIDFGCGHINSTFCVTTESSRRYILQKINENTFRDPDALMENIVRVTEHLRSVNDDPRAVLNLVPTYNGKYHIRNHDGCWRVYDFVEGTICLQEPESERDFYEVAVGFGRFQQQLKDFPAETLHESIPNFHNTPDRYRIFHEVLNADCLGRAKSVQREIDFFLSHEEEMATLQTLRDSGELPTRVTHNDTKLNNVLLDAKTRKALCVIDLDTVMPGLSLYDFGDSIRFGAATAAEDETELARMTLGLSLFETFTRGYMESCSDLTALEREFLPLGAKTITIECALRFLTDYLDGDRYFATHRPGHNLDRARAQIALASDMEKKWDAMRKIVESI